MKRSAAIKTPADLVQNETEAKKTKRKQKKENREQNKRKRTSTNSEKCENENKNIGKQSKVSKIGDPWELGYKSRRPAS